MDQLFQSRPHRSTKPDYTVFENDKVKAFFYLDGASVHLSREDDGTTKFEKFDVPLRRLLAEQHKVPVITLSNKMVDRWYKSMTPSFRWYSTNPAALGTPNIVLSLLNKQEGPPQAQRSLWTNWQASFVDEVMRELVTGDTSKRPTAYTKILTELGPRFDFASFDATGLKVGPSDAGSLPIKFTLDSAKPWKDSVRGWELYWMLTHFANR